MRSVSRGRRSRRLCRGLRRRRRADGLRDARQPVFVSLFRRRHRHLGEADLDGAVRAGDRLFHRRRRRRPPSSPRIIGGAILFAAIYLAPCRRPPTDHDAHSGKMGDGPAAILIAAAALAPGAAVACSALSRRSRCGCLPHRRGERQRRRAGLWRLDRRQHRRHLVHDVPAHSDGRIALHHLSRRRDARRLRRYSVRADGKRKPADAQASA